MAVPKIVGVTATTIPDEFMLRITPGHGRIHKCRVLWCSDDAMRVQFVDRIATAKEPDLAYTVREHDAISMIRDLASASRRAPSGPPRSSMARQSRALCELISAPGNELAPEMA